jgi:glycolate oxidase iron-sulfur subunit
MYNAADQNIERSDPEASAAGVLPHVHNYDASHCVRCGNCKSACPTYLEFINEGMSARGRVVLMKKFIAGEIERSDTLDHRIFTCLLCGSCNTRCPLGISVTDAVYEGRRKLAKSRKRWLFRAIMKYVFTDPERSLRLLQFLDNAGLLLPLSKLKPFSAFRELHPRIPKTRLRNEINIFKASKPRGRVAVFAGCTVDFLYPAMGLSLIHTLNALDYDVVLPKGEVCCGAPLLASGLRDETALLAEKNINAFKKLQAEAVISLCPTCTHFIKNEYPKIIGAGIGNALDITQFLADKPIDSATVKKDEPPGTVIYHDPCHSVNYLGVQEEPRSILRNLGYEIAEPEERGCCGLGGTVRLLHDDVSNTILANRVDVLERARAAEMSGVPETVVTSCPNCVLQLESRIKDRPVKHVIELIAANIKRRT